MTQCIARHVWWLAAYISLEIFYFRGILDMGFFQWLQIHDGLFAPSSPKCGYQFFLYLLLLVPWSFYRHAKELIAFLLQVKPVEYDGILPESEELPDIVSNTGGSIGKEYKAVAFHQPVLKKKGDKQLEGLVHAYCRQSVLFFFCLDMYDRVLNERPVLLVLSLALRFLVSYAYVVNADIAAFLSTIFYARCRSIIFQLVLAVPSPVVFRDKLTCPLLTYDRRKFWAYYR